MENAENANDLVARFVKNRNDSKTADEMADFMASIRDDIERQGRLYELRDMIKYHQRAADLATTEEEKNTHLADVIILEARISFLEQPRETPPVTTTD